MNTEKINAASGERFEKLSYKDEWAKSLYQMAFNHGAFYAAENPDVIGCVTVEEAMRFAEWLFKEGWKFPSEYEPDKWFKLVPADEELYGVNKVLRKTTAELFDIYKQQKP